GKREIRAIQSIVHFHAELRAYPFGDRNLLNQRCVEIEEAGTTEGVAPGTANLARTGEIRRLRQGGYLLGRKEIYAITALLDFSNRPVATEVDVLVQSGAGGTAAARNRKHGAGLQGSKRADLPAANYTVDESI